MKHFFALLLLCLGFSAFGAAPIGTNISRYPNTNVAPASALLLLAVTNEVPATNYNIKVSDIGLQLTNTPVVTNWTLIPPGLTFLTNWVNAVSNYVTAATNSASVTNWTILAQPASANLTNWSLIPTGAMANSVSTTFLTNWANAISNFAVAQGVIVSNGVIVEILNASNILSGNSFARLEVQTNGVRLALATNLNWAYGVTGFVSGATATLGVDASVIATNAGGIISTNLGLNTNSGIFSVQYEPNRGSLWYSGTNGIPTTNQARAGFEFHPFWRATRAGELGDGIHPVNLGGQGTNYWNETNIGVVSFAQGSNVQAKARFSAIGGGRVNIILTNSDSSVIAGGHNNFIDTNSPNSTIGGGGFNKIYGVATAGINRNATIGGGSNNTINGPVTIGSTIAGGGDNSILTDNIGYASMAGGFANSINIDGSYGFLGGGNQNSIGEVGHSAGEAQGAVVVGGEQNTGQGLRSFVGGGRLNGHRARDNDYSVVVGGHSNTIGVAGGDFESKLAFIGGGAVNNIANDCTHSSIVGGNFNQIAGVSTNSFIGGGYNNTIASSANNAAILGGKDNSAGGNFTSIIGSSNSITGLRATGVGNNLTNNRADTVMLGAFGGVSKVELQRSTNASIGGTIISITTPVASAGAAETNLIAVTIPAHTLTNSQDRTTFRFSGRFAATANAKQLKLVYGSETILDTSSQVVNSGAWTVEGEIIRTGNTSQSVSAEFHGAGEAVFTTAASLDLAQTNGIATVLKMTSTAAGNGDATNRTATVMLWPAP